MVWSMVSISPRESLIREVVVMGAMVLLLLSWTREPTFSGCDSIIKPCYSPRHDSRVFAILQGDSESLAMAGKTP